MANHPAPRHRVLLGRSGELRLIREQLERARLVTLTGPGGVGKTRLAMAMYEELRAAGREAWFVDASGVVEPGLLSETIAIGLGLTITRLEAPDGAVDAYLGTRAAVLVLDNLEQVPDAPTIVGKRLEGSNHLRILATSRLPLGLPIETEHPVPGLALPTAPTPVAIAASPAGELFLARASAVGQPVDLGSDGAFAVAEVLRRLDGLPLAVELAAARSRVLTPTALLRRLDDVSVLAREPRSDEERHASLVAVLDSSLALLGDRERALLEALSITEGPFDLSLAQAVGPEEPVVPALDALVAAGLVWRDGEVEGDARFRLLETIRAHVRRGIGVDRREELEARQAGWVLTLAREASLELLGPRQRSMVSRIAHARPTIRAAMAWAIAHDPDLGLEVAATISNHWEEQPMIGEPIGWLRAAMERARPDHPGRPLAVAALIRLLVAYDGPAAALALFPVAEAQLAAADPRTRRRIRMAVALAQFASGDYTAAGATNIAAAPDAESTIEADAFRRSGEALIHIAAGDAAAAASAYEAARDAAAGAGNPFNVAANEYGLAVALLRLGRASAAVAAARRACDLLGGGYPAAYPLAILALALGELGELRAAQDAFREAWSVVEREAPIERVEALEAAVSILGQGGCEAEAVAVLAVTRRHRTAIGWQAHPFVGWVLERHERRARAKLGEVAHRQNVGSAAKLDLASAARLALDAPLPARASARDRARGPVAALTPRELGVLELIGRGWSDRRIAEALSISPKTVSVHAVNIKAKLGLETRLGVALQAREFGLAADPDTDPP